MGASSQSNDSSQLDAPVRRLLPRTKMIEIGSLGKIVSGDDVGAYTLIQDDSAP
jgi:hypothetical protein